MANLSNNDAPNASAVRYLPATYYDKFLSETAKARKPSPIRSLYPLEDIPGMISLLAGKPNATTFPFTSFKFTAQSPSGSESELSISGGDLSQSLQYAATAGIPRLIQWISGLQGHSHGRYENEGWRVTIGSGSQDLIYKAVNAIINPGESVLIERPTYAGAIPMFQTLKCDMIEIATDSNGICSNDLRSILSNWPAGKPKPKVLYTIPYGCNPTGMTATTERRKEVLSLATEHDFIILEDDPYYYLYYGEAERPPSYFTLELQEESVGRVLRFDSLSKILSAGMRIGFASGPERLIAAMDLHTSTANLQCSSLPQVIAFKLLESWGYDGFVAHTRRVSEFYRNKRDVFEGAMNRHLKGLVEWTSPQSGMFLWFKLLLSSDQSSVDNDADDGDSETLIRSKAVERGVLALPGTAFLPNGGKTAYVRASFSLSTPEEVDEAMRRLATVILDARAGSH